MRGLARRSLTSGLLRRPAVPSVPAAHSATCCSRTARKGPTGYSTLTVTIELELASIWSPAPMRTLNDHVPLSAVHGIS
jgi:hypothetical protein